jgi:hypothetical protein
VCFSHVPFACFSLSLSLSRFPLQVGGGSVLYFLVLYVIRIFIFLNNLVKILSFPMYVNVAHFCFCVVLSVILLFPLVLYLSVSVVSN